MIFLGANLEPEGFELGEIKINATAEIDDLEPVYIIAYSGDQILNSQGGVYESVGQSGYSYNGVFSSVTFILTNEYGFNVIMEFLNSADNSNHVVTVFSVPKLAVKNKLPNDSGGTHTYFVEVMDYDFNQPATSKTLNSRPSSIDGYTPRNKKLLTYPYLYVGFNPYNGSQKIYRYEDFSNATPVFNIMSEINPNPTVAVIPQNYRGASGDSLSDIATITGYPTISYKTDTFNTWLAQNGNILNIQMEQEKFNYNIDMTKKAVDLGTNIGMTAGSIATGGLINPSSIGNAINSGIDMYALSQNHEFYIKNQMAQVEKQKMMPDQVNMGSSNATLMGYEKIDKNIFTRYSISSQFARKIDKFFDMYGYLTNERKLPNLNNRPNWNYVKTIGANIIGNIPQTDLQMIKNIFDNGVTLWHNSSTFLDYSQNNR